VGHYASPYSSGSGYLLLHHNLGEVNGRRGVWGHAMGGMGAITQALAQSAKKAGAEISTDTPVRQIIIERGQVAGVVLENGSAIHASAVAANVNPKLLYEKLIPPSALPAEFVVRMKSYRCESATFRMNVALTRLPSFLAKPGHELADHHTAGIILAPAWLIWIGPTWRRVCTGGAALQ
jgi:phytoene dehydrogenase-like protein